MSDAVIIHRPGVQVKASDGGSTFASFTIPFPSFPGLAVELLELEAVHWVLDSEARMRQDAAE